jgi:hypothetical protein
MALCIARFVFCDLIAAIRRSDIRLGTSDEPAIYAQPGTMIVKLG